jgi:dienelactone hydrolase
MVRLAGGTAVFLVALIAALPAQVPATDIRNTETPESNTHFTLREYGSLQEWQVKRLRLRRQILTAAGLLPMPHKTPLHPQIFGRTEYGNYSIEKVLIETLPGFYLAGNLYRPMGRKGRFPGVLSPHGHWKHGRLENTAQVSVPGRGISLARQGYVVFAYDMVGFGDTKQLDHDFGGKAEQLWSFTPLGLQLWNSIRAVDFMQSLRDVDDSRIAVTGASGGATQTLLLAAVDSRVKVDAPVVMVSNIMQGDCVCENASGLRLDTCNVEIAAMMAPRPMIVVSATGDWTRHVPQEEFPAIQKIYALFGKPENAESVQIEGGHNYNRQSREAVYRFFGKHITRDPEAWQITEAPFEVPSLNDLHVLNGHKLPEDALDAVGVFSRWKEIGVPASSDRLTRFVLSAYLTVQWPRQVQAAIGENSIEMTRMGVGDRVAGYWFPGSPDKRAALVIHPDGADAARKLPMVERLIREGNPTLLIDAFQTGKAKTRRNRSHKFFLTFNRSDEAARVQDILTALHFLRSQRQKGLDLMGVNDAGVWCLFAAAVAPATVKLYANLKNFKGTDEDFIRRFFVPGIQRAGGLNAALRLAKPLPLPE